MTTCIDNLEACGATCCKLLPFELNVPIGHHMEDYYRKRGLLVTRINRNTIKIVIPHECAQLTSDLKCALHDTSSKPYACRAFNELTANNGKYHIPLHCIYEKKDDKVEGAK